MNREESPVWCDPGDLTARKDLILLRGLEHTVPDICLSTETLAIDRMLTVSRDVLATTVVVQRTHLVLILTTARKDTRAMVKLVPQDCGF